MSITNQQTSYGTDVPYGEILVTEQQLSIRFEEMAVDVVRRYKGENPLFVSLLNGGVQFTAALMSRVVGIREDFHPQVVFAQASAYGENRTAGEVTMGYIPGLNRPEQPVVILDDLLDTGVTAAAIEDHYKVLGARYVDLIVMASKPKTRERWQKPTMCGFELPDVWLTGMGLDDPSIAKEGNRWLPFIAMSLAQPPDTH